MSAPRTEKEVREAWDAWQSDPRDNRIFTRFIFDLLTEARADEREACARIADDAREEYSDTSPDYGEACGAIADAIRARTKTAT